MYSGLYSGALGVGSRREYGQVPEYSVGTMYLINQKSVYCVVCALPICRFYVNRIVHAFTAAGVLPSQYARMSIYLC